MSVDLERLHPLICSCHEKDCPRVQVVARHVQKLILEARIEELRGQKWNITNFMDLQTYNDTARYKNEEIMERISELTEELRRMRNV